MLRDWPTNAGHMQTTRIGPYKRKLGGEVCVWWGVWGGNDKKRSISVLSMFYNNNNLFQTHSSIRLGRAWAYGE